MTPRSDVSAERRTQIIEAALACFTSKGYNNTTMDDIVAESGLSKGSLYWYFKSKDELFEASILSVFTDVGEQALVVMEECSTTADQLRAMAQVTANVGRMLVGYFSLFLEFWASSQRREESAQLWVDMLIQYKDLLVGIIEEGIQKGELKPVDAEPLVWAILAAYDGLAAYLAIMPDLDLDRASAVFAETLLSGLVVDQQENEGEKQ
jgi:AcrR family transcriptional regulator